METTKVKWILSDVLIVLYAVGIILCAGYEFKIIPMDFLVPSSSNITSNNTQPVTTETAADKLRNKINAKISNKYFVNDENGLYTVIHFIPSNEGAPLGAMMLSQMQCNFSFTYSIDGKRITTEFLKSDCGRTSPNAAVFYNEAGDYLYMVINGEKYIFKDLNQ